MNDWLADVIYGAQKTGGARTSGACKALVGEKLDKEGESEGAEGRLLTFEKPVTMEQLETRIKKGLNLKHSASFGVWKRVKMMSDAFVCSTSRLWHVGREEGSHSDGSDLCGLRRVDARGQERRLVLHWRDVPCSCSQFLIILQYEANRITSLQHEILASVASGRNVILCSSNLPLAFLLDH